MAVETSSLRTLATETLAPRLGERRECALLDFQNHGNVGDSAIWLGEVAWLARIGCRIRHVCGEFDYDPASLRRAIGDGPILLSGGGNLGDLWPAIQRFREQVLLDFPRNRVIQLPQSIHFGDPANARRARSVLTGHGDFHLLTRDKESLAVAESQLGVQAVLCPDMVHMLDVPPFSGPKPHRLVVLSREDQEKLEPPAGAVDGARSTDWLVKDWLDQPRLPEERLYRRARRRVRTRWLPSAPFEKQALRYANALATERVRWGCALLGSGRAIVTDRLHACLLGRLGGSRVYFVDNIYRKLSSYVDTWLTNDPDLIACRDFTEALSRADAETP